MEANHTEMGNVMNTNNLFSLFKGPACFKASKGRSIDPVLTNKKQSFMKGQSFETGFSDHHHLIYTILTSFHRNVFLSNAIIGICNFATVDATR